MLEQVFSRSSLKMPQWLRPSHCADWTVAVGGLVLSGVLQGLHIVHPHQREMPAPERYEYHLKADTFPVWALWVAWVVVRHLSFVRL